MKANVLIVDDDAAIRRALSDRMKFWGHTVSEAADGQAALDTVAQKEFDLILLDLKMPGIAGLDVLTQMREVDVPSDIVVITAHGSVEIAVEAIRKGASDFLLKPVDFEIIQSVVDRALERRRLRRVNRALIDQAEVAGGFLVGASEKMAKLAETATQAARSNTTVLLTGESGSGKQVMAEFIHKQSNRCEGPFVYINCVALTDELIESTLFGHEKGAFTGALSRKEGRVEAANGGTAFLDEVGDISSNLQTKLLHFLETGEFERVGGTRTLSVDCRVIAATNRDLKAAIRDGRFREDLYYRLNVINLQLPPLRERREDIPLLAEKFLEQMCRELKRDRLKLAARTAEIMSGYPWPGNVRQLKNAVERMAVLARTDTLTPDLLPPEIFEGEESAEMDPGITTLKDATLEFRKSYIRKALAKTGGNQKEAAELLQIQRTFLNRLIKQYGI
jgi:DNA-binding NtrC family response regulator